MTGTDVVVDGGVSPRHAATLWTAEVSRVAGAS